MNNIARNLKELSAHIPSHVTLVAVSKTKSIADIKEAINAGQFTFGENKVQELTDKYAQLPEAKWHFIGHLQTNKVKYIIPFVQMIHAVDSLRVLEEIDKQAQKYDRTINCLLQIHIATEETKFGMTEEEAVQLLEAPQLHDLHHVKICGLMGVATYTDEELLIRKEFAGLATFFNRLKQDYFSSDNAFCELSMGMSSDYLIAIEEGSTMVRVGSSIFGERIYQ